MPKPKFLRRDLVFAQLARTFFSGVLDLKGRSIYDPKTAWYVRRAVEEVQRRTAVEWATKSFDRAIARLSAIPHYADAEVRSEIRDMANAAGDRLYDLLYPNIRTDRLKEKMSEAMEWRAEYERVFGDLDSPEGQQMIQNTLDLLRAPPAPSQESARLADLRVKLEEARKAQRDRSDRMRRHRLAREM